MFYWEKFIQWNSSLSYLDCWHDYRFFLFSFFSFSLNTPRGFFSDIRWSYQKSYIKHVPVVNMRAYMPYAHRPCKRVIISSELLLWGTKLINIQWFLFKACRWKLLFTVLWYINYIFVSFVANRKISQQITTLMLCIRPTFMHAYQLLEHIYYECFLLLGSLNKSIPNISK